VDNCFDNLLLLKKMLQEACEFTPEHSVLRRVSFAAASLPEETPGYWEFVTSFGFHHSVNKANADVNKVRLYMENTKCLDPGVFHDDRSLKKELISQEGFQGHSIGIVLISPNNTCKSCNGKLLIKRNRPSFPMVYDYDLGTVSSTHFRKFCQNVSIGCSFTQHYGYYTLGNDSEMFYDKNCLDLPYFVSSAMTAISSRILRSLSAEILLSQTSYTQRTDVYNYFHGYDGAIAKSTFSTANEKYVL